MLEYDLVNIAVATCYGQMNNPVTVFYLFGGTACKSNVFAPVTAGLGYADIFSDIRYAVITAAAVLLTGVISSAYSAYRLSLADTGNILREGD